MNTKPVTDKCTEQLKDSTACVHVSLLLTSTGNNSKTELHVSDVYALLQGTRTFHDIKEHLFSVIAAVSHWTLLFCFISFINCPGALICTLPASPTPNAREFTKLVLSRINLIYRDLTVRGTRQRKLSDNINTDNSSADPGVGIGGKETKHPAKGGVGWGVGGSVGGWVEGG